MATVRCVFVHDLEVPRGHRCARHAHAVTEIVYSRGCAGVLHQGGEELRYGDDTVFVYQPGDDHWIENEVAGAQICVGAVGLGLEEISPGVYPAGADLVELFDEVQRSVRRARRYDEQRLDLLAGMISLSLAEAVSPPRPERTRAERVRDIIDAEFAMEWDVASLAREVYVTPDYLRQLFRAEYGEPVIHYLINRRVEYAKVLLAETDDSVAAVAEACGFRDPYYFSRVFRKHVGSSPTEFRAGATGTRRA